MLPTFNDGHALYSSPITKQITRWLLLVSSVCSLVLSVVGCLPGLGDDGQRQNIRNMEAEGPQHLAVSDGYAAGLARLIISNGSLIGAARLMVSNVALIIGPSIRWSQLALDDCYTHTCMFSRIDNNGR